MNTGDILWGMRGSDAIHPIVYLQYKDSNFFVGAMLTTSDYADNILMAEKHFKIKDSKGIMYKFLFRNTHLVNAKLVKRNEWGPFEKVGELTVEGIEFVESRIKAKNPVFWEEYLNTKNKFPNFSF